MIDVTSTKSRTWRLALLGGITGISIPIGNVISAYVYASGGYLGIWITSLSLHSCALIYIVFLIKDSRGKSLEPTTEKDTNQESKENADLRTRVLRKVMSVFRNLWKNFVITFQRREGYKRAIICILLLSNCLHLLSVGITHYKYNHINDYHSHLS